MAYRCRNTLLRLLENGEIVTVYEGGQTIKDTRIKDVVVRDNYILDKVRINNSILNNVKFRNATIRRCVLHHCFLEDCIPLNSVLKHCQDIKSPIALRRFAPEIRLLIFDYIIEGDGKIPLLMKALIGDQVLYREALGVLYKKSPIPVSFVKKMVSADIQSITKLVIE